MLLHQSLSTSSKKLVIMIPSTMNFRTESPFERSVKRAKQQNQLVTKYKKKNSTPARENLLAEDSSALINLSLLKKLDKISHKKQYTSKALKTISSNEKTSSIYDSFSLSPINAKKNKHLRALSRRPHHMSFRNFHKNDLPEKKIYSPLACNRNHEFSSNILSNVIISKHKPIKRKLSSRQNYKPANWHRNIFNINTSYNY